jgi:hypothetical protein
MFYRQELRQKNESKVFIFFQKNPLRSGAMTFAVLKKRYSWKIIVRTHHYYY